MMSPSQTEQVNRIAGWLGSGSINIFGPPFSGKDTQAQSLSKLLNASIIGGGEILRSRNDKQVRKIIDRGGLAPTEDYLNIVVPYLSRPAYAGRPLILSSVGRWHGEEQSIVQAAKEAGHPIKVIIFIKLDEAAVRERWLVSQTTADRGQRDDDAKEFLNTRLEEFRNKTLPVIDFYREKGLLIEIDGSPKLESVTANILASLARKANE